MRSTTTSVQEKIAVSGAKRWLLMSFPPLLLLAFLLLPWPLMEKLRAIGRTVCMLRPSHSYFLAGEQLPLEARTTGMYAGFLIALGYFLIIGRGRAAHFPPKWLTAVLVGFVAVMGFDGLNSTAFDLGLPHLYAPGNPLRLITGLLTGVAMGSFILPLVNTTLWEETRPRAVLGSLKDLGGLLVIELLFFLGVVSGIPWLLYPVSFVTAGGVVAVFFTLTLAIIGSLARSWNKIRQGWNLLLFVDLALLLTVAELGLLMAFMLWVRQCPIQG